MTHSQDLEKLLLEILVKDRRARVIARERPCHPVQQDLMKITPGGRFLAKYVQYPLDGAFDGGRACLHPLLNAAVAL